MQPPRQSRPQVPARPVGSARPTAISPRFRPGELRPRRLLIALALIAIGLVWSYLDGTARTARNTAAPATVIIHGPVAVQVQGVDGIVAAPEVIASSPTAPRTQIDFSLRNTGTAARPVAPRDVALRVGGRTYRSNPDVVNPLQPLSLAPGVTIKRALRFDHPLGAGATFVYTPSWDPGHPLRWLLYQ